SVIACPSRPVHPRTRWVVLAGLCVQNDEPVSAGPTAPLIALTVTLALDVILTPMLNPLHGSVAAVVLTCTVFVDTVPNEMVPPTPSADAGNNRAIASVRPVPPASSNARTRFTRILQGAQRDSHFGGVLEAVIRRAP